MNHKRFVKTFEILQATTKTAANIGAENAVDSLTAPQVDKKNDRNADESNPESLPQFSPQNSQNQERNHQNGESIEKFTYSLKRVIFIIKKGS